MTPLFVLPLPSDAGALPGRLQLGVGMSMRMRGVSSWPAPVRG